MLEQGQQIQVIGFLEQFDFVYIYLLKELSSLLFLDFSLKTLGIQCCFVSITTTPPI